jgi:hypothetical protein
MRGLLIVLIPLFFAGCGKHMPTPAETLAASDLVVLGELRVENGQEKLFAVEVLKGALGNDISYRLGEQIVPTLGSLKNVASADGKVLLCYQKRFGSECWLMTMTASDMIAPLVEELRKKANQPLQPTPSGRG